MRILVTGGAGFIGSNFILYMLNKYPNYEVVNMDSLTYAGNIQNLASVENNPNYSFIQADITDRQIVEQIMSNGIDKVVNFAAESHVDRSIQNPDVFLKTNVLGTHVLLESAKKFGVSKFVQISTDEVYGTLGAEGLFTEDTPLAPNSPYSASKAGGDLIARAYYETYHFPVSITRCSNNYGPYQFPEKLIPMVLTKALRNEKIPVYGDGLNVRDWLYVEDHCSAIDLVLHKGKDGEVYNIGGNNERTNLQIVNTILNEINKNHNELISFVTDRLGHDRRYAIDASKIRTELGWEPKYNFEVGIKKTVDWYIKNQEWLEALVKKV
ncbi:dTDP-glucose 4,6-dehydratase [Paenibacillus sp. VCA1]|uniref:dTDP-glucose 4,6-dehydratase n=1 Tax=Paenibacillus sp. VCA1 TaxID=3039148 RepID=UPI0028725E3C|nr:dTDP-glucose 4,6-dehydratase [Paenibacillus sp. VCA1]MDR9853297.1 dTDP-glucose 4,6-dehydratase [Paenibacillus sp. VCA1]